MHNFWLSSCRLHLEAVDTYELFYYPEVVSVGEFKNLIALNIWSRKIPPICPLNFCQE
jgi:hypothetical protein